MNPRSTESGILIMDEVLDRSKSRLDLHNTDAFDRLRSSASI